MPSADALSVVLTIRSNPPLLVFLVEMLDDVEERRRLAELGSFEYRVGTGPWTPLDTWRRN